MMMTQEEALDILKSGANVFLTGEPGSGKTHTVNAYVEWLRARSIEPAITASTGIAATHIGGMTIHSWSGIGVKRWLSDEDVDAIAQKKNVVRRVVRAPVLIIDEVSMLSADTLSMVDAVCREVRRTARPFGGVQVVLVGDFFQLPPVSGGAGYTPSSQELFDRRSDGSRFAFSAPAWGALRPLVCYLSEHYRQEDADFLELLLAVRRGACTDAHRALLEGRRAVKPAPGAPKLYSHNADVDSINSAELAKLDAPLHTFEMKADGAEQVVAALKRGCLSPETLSLKEGARVMFTKNDIVHERYVNGTLGAMVGFEEENGYPIVQTDAGRVIVAEPDEWRVEDGGRVLARIEQVPLRLAWAMTVHKSQGMSLDSAHMDLSDAFEYGQGYVALSRVRALSGLSLAGFNERALEVHPDILAKDEEFRALSDATRNEFGKLDAAARAEMHANFIQASGGKEPDLQAISDVRRQPLQAGGTRRGERKSSREETAEHIRSGMTIEEAAETRGFKPCTILSHVKKCVEEGVISRSEITHLVAGNEAAVAEIHRACEELGTEKLKPIFEYCNGAHSYDTIQRAVLLFEK